MLFSAISLFRQSIVFVDDFQWVDQISFEVLKRFLALQPVCMLVISFRTEKSDADIFAYGTDLRKIGIRKLLNIRPFSRAEIKELVSSRIGEIQDAEVLDDALSSQDRRQSIYRFRSSAIPGEHLNTQTLPDRMDVQ